MSTLQAPLKPAKQWPIILLRDLCHSNPAAFAEYLSTVPKKLQGGLLKVIMN